MTIVVRPDGIRIPGSIDRLERFREWSRSDAFPEKGRIDSIAGNLEIDVSPEDFNAHATAKAALARDHGLIVEGALLGAVASNSMRGVAPEADLSVEPDDSSSSSNRSTRDACASCDARAMAANAASRSGARPTSPSSA